MTGFDSGQLTGFRIGVTSDRRSGDLITALQRRGAEVLHAPTLRIVPADEDAKLIDDTHAVIAAHPEIVLATTAYGVRGWLEAADAAGLGSALLEVLEKSSIRVRGPKARGAIRAAGLDDDGMGDDETTAALVSQVLQSDISGLTVAVQLHGYIDQAQLDRLSDAGATVLTVAPYRWTEPAEPARVHRLLDAAVSGGLDAVTFTSAPAAEALLVAAKERGVREELVAAFRSRLVALAVGPVTAEPLTAAGIESLYPERFRLGALIRLACEHLGSAGVHTVQTSQGALSIRGRQVQIGEQIVSLPPSSLMVLRMLADAGGAVVPKSTLLQALPDAQDEHALEVSIARLRASLNSPGVVATVVKRGYRLDVVSS